MSKLSDEKITAYLDGALSPEEVLHIDEERALDHNLDQRIRQLDFNVATLGRNFDEMLGQAPHFTFELDEQKPVWRGAAMAASIIAMFGFGFAAATLTKPVSHENLSWVDAVAQYQMLYRTASLKDLNPTPEQRKKQLRPVAAKLGFDLSQAKISVNGLEYKNTNLLFFKDMPLAQIAYLDKQNRPVSFCIIKRKKNSVTDIKTRTLNKQMQVAEWSRGQYGFMVIGNVDKQEIIELAKQFKALSADL